MGRISLVGVTLFASSLVYLSRAQLDARVEDDNVIFVNEVQVPVVWQVFNGTALTVDAGSPLDLKCGIHGDYDGCEWRGPDGTTYNVYEDVYKGLVTGVGKPLETYGNECGIVIDAAAKEHNGQWTCNILGRNSLSRSKKVTVVAKTTFPPGTEKCGTIAVQSGYCVPFTSCPDKLNEPLKLLTIRQFVEAFGCGRDGSGVTMVCCPE